MYRCLLDTTHRIKLFHFRFNQYLLKRDDGKIDISVLSLMDQVDIIPVEIKKFHFNKDPQKDEQYCNQDQQKDEQCFNKDQPKAEPQKKKIPKVKALKYESERKKILCEKNIYTLCNIAEAFRFAAIFL